MSREDHRVVCRSGSDSFTWDLCCLPPFKYEDPLAVFLHVHVNTARNAIDNSLYIIRSQSHDNAVEQTPNQQLRLPVPVLDVCIQPVPRVLCCGSV